MLVRELLTRLGLESDEALAKAEQFDGAIGKIKDTAKAVTGAVAGLSAGMFALATNAAGNADQIAKAARDVGIHSDAYQELTYAADQYGISQEQVATGLRDLNKNVGEAASGNKGLQETFAQLGIDVLDASGKVKSAEDILGEMADGLQKIESPAVRSAMVLKLMGESGNRMGVLLNDGSSNLDTLRQKARDLGIVLDEEALTASEEFNDRLADMKGVIVGVKNIIGIQMIPIIRKAVVSVTNWFMANRELIQQNIGEFFEKAAVFIGKFYRFVGEAIGFVNRFAQALGGWESVFKIVIGWMAVFMGLKIIGFVTALITVIKNFRAVMLALNAAMLLNPVVFITAAFVALGTALYVWAQRNEKVKERILTVWNAIKEFFKAIPGFFKNIFSALTDTAKRWADRMMKIVRPVIDAFKFVAEKGGGIIKGAGRGIRSGVDAVGDFAGGVANTLGFGGDSGQQRQVAGRGGARNYSAVNRSTNNITVNVPQGSSEQQQRAVADQISRYMDKSLTTQTGHILNNFPDAE